MGKTILEKIRRIGAEIAENDSERSMASDFGVISPKINISAVIESTENNSALFSTSLRNRDADTLEARIFTIRLPIRIVISSCRGRSSKEATMRSRCWRLFWNRRNLIWLSENRAVSDPEKKPEKTIRNAIITISKINFVRQADI